MTKYIPHQPTPRQADFLLCEGREAFYGGAAGGGKSDALLMAALQFADVDQYAAIIFRRTHADLALDGALMDRAADWLSQTDAKWKGQDKRWEFPSGASLTFGYMEHESNKFRYKSAEFQFVGFDELTQFSETQYRFMFSRLRRRQGAAVPLRMRGASNPGDVGHDWVKDRFLTHSKDRVFIPARIADNPHLDQTEYVQSLAELDPVTRAQMLKGDWDAYEGGMFRREWLSKTQDVCPAEVAARIRYWDKAGTKDAGAYTAGVRMSITKAGLVVVEDVVRGQWSSFKRNEIIRQTAEHDQATHPGTVAWLEQEPGSGGKESAEISVKELAEFEVHTERATGEKATRLGPFASQAEAGNVVLVRGPWNKAYIDELVLLPNGQYKDQGDGSSGAYNKLILARKKELMFW
jgi:predicted phage terminase large subunit-like protein